MNTTDLLGLVHPAIAVALVFATIGIVANFAWQTRQRRLQTAQGTKSKIPPLVGPEHVSMGRWLTGMVVGISLLALAYVLFVQKYAIVDPAVWQEHGGAFITQLIFFGLTIAALVFLYQAQAKLWRGVFAALSSAGLIVLGLQEGVFRRTNEWFVSHYYYGIAVSILMIVALAMVPEIYRDRTHRWRTAHALLNIFATLLFIGQGITGARDLWEIGFYRAQSAHLPTAPVTLTSQDAGFNPQEPFNQNPSA